MHTNMSWSECVLICGTAGSTKPPAAKDVERQRSSFFQSLRRTSIKTADSDKGAPPSSPSTPRGHAAPPPSPPLDPPMQPLHSPVASEAVTDSPQPTNGISHGAGLTNGHDGNGITNGCERRHSWDASDPRLKVSAEEEAFLRSLGWTEAGDDEDGAFCAVLAWSDPVLLCLKPPKHGAVECAHRWFQQSSEMTGAWNSPCYSKEDSSGAQPCCHFLPPFIIFVQV